jgi:hypothetical protein
MAGFITGFRLITTLLFGAAAVAGLASRSFGARRRRNHTAPIKHATTTSPTS